MSNEETKSIVENNGKAEWVSDVADDDNNDDDDVEAKEREPLQPNAKNQKQNNAANKEVGSCHINQ